MATGDFELTASSLRINGQQWEIDGTAEIDGTLTAFDILPGKHILSMFVHGTDDAGAVEIDLNYDASGTEDQGNVAMASSNFTSQTYNFTVKWV